MSIFVQYIEDYTSKDSKIVVFKLMKKHVNELQMQKYFLGMLLGPKVLLSANNLDIDQK